MSREETLFRARMGTNDCLICGSCGKVGRGMIIRYQTVHPGAGGAFIPSPQELILCKMCANELMNAMVRAVTQTDTEALRIRHDGLDGDV